MTIERLICGTIDEICDYFSFIGSGQTKWCDGMSFDEQIHTISNSDKRIGIIFYIDKKGGLSFSKNWVYIRNDN